MDVTEQQNRIAKRCAFAVIGWINKEIDRAEEEMVKVASAPEDSGDRVIRLTSVVNRIERMNAARDVIGRMPYSVIADEL